MEDVRQLESMMSPAWHDCFSATLERRQLCLWCSSSNIFRRLVTLRCPSFAMDNRFFSSCLADDNSLANFFIASLCSRYYFVSYSCLSLRTSTSLLTTSMLHFSLSITPERCSFSYRLSDTHTFNFCSFWSSRNFSRSSLS